MTVPQRPNQRWSLDFVSKAFVCSRRFHTMAVVDDFDRECMALGARTSLSGARVARELTMLLSERGKPLLVVSDIGSELTSIAILRWSQGPGRLVLYRAGKPTPNACVESFNGRLRDECVNETLFTSLAEARPCCRLVARLQHRQAALQLGGRAPPPRWPANVGACPGPRCHPLNPQA